ncbi:hypothetical protein PVAP13_6KG414225 [Panicum virgatum]|uniref:Uncharacterized protein n=1 Tax=Panicum virgatum TaxID=38727 RepID=A0A8T0RK19_PANVG|nr:hypothetical protein PVAP13_6KG414225 [Panicum virgatum]
MTIQTKGILKTSTIISRVMTWMLQEDFFLERWTSSRWSSRRNQAAGWLPWWHPSLLSSYSFTTLPSRRMPTLASACQQLRVAACDGVYCLIV